MLSLALTVIFFLSESIFYIIYLQWLWYMQIYFLPRKSNLEIWQLSSSQTPCFESAQKQFFFKQSFFWVHIFVLLEYVLMIILLCLSRAKTNYSASFLMSPVSVPAPPARPWLWSFITHIVIIPFLGRARNARMANRSEGAERFPGSWRAGEEQE